MNELFSYPLEKKAKGFLREFLDDEDVAFRSGQLDAIKNAVQGNRVLLVQRTGWGKSMVYFIATKILHDKDFYEGKELSKSGPALMISPLLSLINNQIFHSSHKLKVEQITSQNRIKWKEVEEKIQNENLDMLMLAPERLSDPKFLKNILEPIISKIPLVIIDEVHCISDWGHDFRPDYMRIKNILRNLPERTPLIATTATANDRVISDLEEIIGRNTVSIKGSLYRKSIKLFSAKIDSYDKRLAFIANVIPKVLSRHNHDGKKSTGIVYALTKKDTYRITKWLISNGISAVEYNSDANDKLDTEKKLMNDEVDVVVATNALGMGFDKPNIRFVIHFQTPQSIVHYYQQVGRAGRNIDNAYGICLLGNEDHDINSYFIETAFPDAKTFHKVEEVLSDSRTGLSEAKIAKKINVAPTSIKKALKILASTESPPIEQTEYKKWLRTPNRMNIDWEKVEAIKNTRQLEWEDMQNYLDSKECLMQFLQKRLSDESIDACGNCSVCSTDNNWFSEGPDDELIQKATVFLKKLKGEIKPRKKWNHKFRSWPFLTDHWDSDTESKMIKKEHLIEVGNFLCYYHDPTYGQLLQKGKRKGHFDDVLVYSVADMIKESEFYNKATWVTSVPSLNHLNLVPEFASKVAEAIEKPYINSVKKIRGTDQQKNMINSFHQQKNLDGSFEVTQVRSEPVILIDDIVDSRFTLTIIGALLRNAGCEAVYPITIGSSSKW